MLVRARLTSPIPLMVAALGVATAQLAMPSAALAGIRLSEAPAQRAGVVSGTAPALTPLSDMTLRLGETTDQMLHASDADGHPLTFTKNAGPGYMTVTTTDPGTGEAIGNLHLAPGSSSDLGTDFSEVRVTDGVLSDYKSFYITVQDTVNDAPQLVPPSPMMTRAGRAVDQALSASDANGDPLVFSKVSGPEYMTVTTVNAAAGVGNVHLAPGLSDVGYGIVATVQVTDGLLTDQRSFSIGVEPEDAAVFLGGISDMAVRANAFADQAVYAQDWNEGDVLTISKVSGPAFMTLTSIPEVTFNAASLHLAPGAADVGVTVGVVGVSDGTYTTVDSFVITVEPPNRPPVAKAGGPYTTFVGVPLTLDGTHSVDPDGDPLSYDWVYGDGFKGIGARPVHTFTSAGVFGMTLTVSDGVLSSAATATVTVSFFQARAFTDNESMSIHLDSGNPLWCVSIEPIDHSYSNGDVNLTTIVLRSSGTGTVDEISAIQNGISISNDRDGNGIDEIEACFTKDDLRQLFSKKGSTTVTATFEGSLQGGGGFRAPIDIMVFASGSGQLAASISPNPLKPEAVLTFSTEATGLASVDLFDINGRLVRHAMEAQTVTAGYHDVRIDGRNEQGERLASGIYFYRVRVGANEVTGQLAVLK